MTDDGDGVWLGFKAASTFYLFFMAAQAFSGGIGGVSSDCKMDQNRDRNKEV